MMPGSDDSSGRETVESSSDRGTCGGAAAAEDALEGGQVLSVFAQRHAWAACMAQLQLAADDSLEKMQKVSRHLWSAWWKSLERTLTMFL